MRIGMLGGACVWFVWLLAMLTTGCVGARTGMEAPTDEGVRWRQLSSEHFTLVTNLDAKDAKRVIATHEETYALLRELIAGSGRVLDFHSQLIALRTRAELAEFFPASIAGLYRRKLPLDVQERPTLITYGTPSVSGRMVFAHELAHRFLSAAHGSLPVWLDEGLAEYYSTVRRQGDAPVVGEFHPDFGLASGSVRHQPGHVIYQGRLIPLHELPQPSDLMQLDHAAFYAHDEEREGSFESEKTRSGHYAAGWALVHMLMHGSSSSARAFQETFAPGTGSEASNDDPLSTNAQGRLQALLDQLETDSELDARFLEYWKAPKPWRQHHAKPPPKVALVEDRELPPGEVYTWWARLAGIKSMDDGTVQKWVSRALEEASGLAEVNFWYGRYLALNGDPKGAQNHLKSAVEAAPRNGSYRLALALLYLNDGKQFQTGEQALAEAMAGLAEVASTSEELHALGVYHLLHRAPQEAADLATRAAVQSPDCWSCFHTAAAAVFALGDQPRAVRLQTAASLRLPEDASRAELAEVQRALAYYRGDGTEQAGTPTTLFVPR